MFWASLMGKIMSKLYFIVLFNQVLIHLKVENSECSATKFWSTLKWKIQSALQPSVKPPFNEKLCKNHVHSVLEPIFVLHLSGISCENLWSRSFWSRSFGSGTLRSRSFGSGTLRSRSFLSWSFGSGSFWSVDLKDII